MGYLDNIREKAWQARIDKEANELLADAADGGDGADTDGMQLSVKARGIRDEIERKLLEGESVQMAEWEKLLELQILEQLTSRRQSVRSAAMKALKDLHERRLKDMDKEKPGASTKKTPGEAMDALRKLGQGGA